MTEVDRKGRVWYKTLYGKKMLYEESGVVRGERDRNSLMIDFPAQDPYRLVGWRRIGDHTSAMLSAALGGF